MDNLWQGKSPADGIGRFKEKTGCADLMGRKTTDHM